jgi:hypothetical protein
MEVTLRKDDTSEAEPVDIAEICSRYSDRLTALSLIKQVSHLVQAIQLHRGLGMSLIAGYEQFSTDFSGLQVQVRRRMRLLSAFASQSPHILAEAEIHKLNSAWAVIERGWQEDSVLENFEYHSHFIEQLLQLLMGLARYIERPVADDFAALEDAKGVQNPVSGKSNINTVGLLVFVCNQLPGLVESIAKIRGLSTLATSRTTISELESSKLKYFMQNSRVQHEKVRLQADRLLDVTRDQIKSLPLIKAYEFKLMFLLTTIEKEVLSAPSIQMNSRQLFDLATEIIDVYWQVVDEGTSLLYQWQEEMLERWFQGGS